MPETTDQSAASQWVHARGTCNTRATFASLRTIISDAVDAANQLSEHDRRGRRFYVGSSSDPNFVISVNYEVSDQWHGPGRRDDNLYFQVDKTGPHIIVSPFGYDPPKFTMTPIWQDKKSRCVIELRDYEGELIKSKLTLAQACQRILGPFFFDLVT